MTPLTRRQLVPKLAAIAALPSLVPLTWAADTPEFRLRFAHNTPTDHPLHIYWAKAADKIKEQTNGRVSIEIFPNNQLGGDTEMLSQLRSGAIQMQGLSTTILSNLVPATALPGTGFAWKNYDSLFAGLDGDLGSYMRAAILKSGLVPMERMYDNGFRQLTTTAKPIQNAGDLKGMKIRVPVTPMLLSVFKSLDAAPTPLNWGETYMALQTKVVDGQENPISTLYITKMYEVQKHCALTSHVWDGMWVLASGKAWNALPDDVKGIVARNFNEQALLQRPYVRKLNETQLTELEAKGMVFNKPDIASFQDMLRKSGFYVDWKQKFGPEAWALLEKYTGQLA